MSFSSHHLTTNNDGSENTFVGHHIRPLETFRSFKMTFKSILLFMKDTQIRESNKKSVSN